ncbi:hypothetical protein HK102_014032 [Quaeritorhiza haematococci]|nr:hypothetical protein HK102_014032 [Quaeritorhiza haematococci]
MSKGRRGRRAQTTPRNAAKTDERNGGSPASPASPANEPWPEGAPPHVEHSAYAKVFANWNADGGMSFRAASPNDQLEHHIFKRFFFDVLEALHELSTVDALKSEIYRLESGWGHIIQLRETTTYTLHSLLLLTPSGVPSSQLVSGDLPSGAQPQLQPEIGRTADSPPAKDDTSLIKRGDIRPPEAKIAPSPPTHFDSSVLPKLPPEVISMILQDLSGSETNRERHTGSRYPGRFVGFAACALVNKTWNSVAMPLMWKHPRLNTKFDTFRFVRWILDRSCLRRNDTNPGMWVVKLDLRCGDPHSVWPTVVRNLFLFPNLRRLILNDIFSADDVCLLFHQDLPALQELVIKPCIEFFIRRFEGGFDYSYAPSVDRERSRAFFSQLFEVNFRSAFMRVELNSDPSLFLDAAHENLRQIRLPPNTPDIIAKRFFENCSSALSVVCSFGTVFSPWLSEFIGIKCTGLRALDLRETASIDLNGFECLMRLCGPHLIALRLGSTDDPDSPMDSRLIRSVAAHCRSLQALSIVIYEFLGGEESFKEDLLDLVRQCGQTLWYFSVSVEGWEGLLGRVLLETIADSCPNLRCLQSDVWDDSPPESDEEESDQEGTVEPVENVISEFDEKESNSEGTVEHAENNMSEFDEEESGDGAGRDSNSGLPHGKESNPGREEELSDSESSRLEDYEEQCRAIFNCQVGALSKIIENCEFLEMLCLARKMGQFDPPPPLVAAKVRRFSCFSCEHYFNWKHYSGRPFPG